MPELRRSLALTAETPGTLDELLSTTDPDRSLRMRRLFEHARGVFDNEADARAWLATPNAALSGKPPLSLVDTDAGARLVDDVLTRIEFGVYA